MDNSDIRNRLIRFAYKHPDKREVILPRIKKLSGGGHEPPSYMTVSNLKKIAVQALQLLNMIDQQTHLSDWAESHVTEAASKMDSVYEYMMYPSE